MDQFVLEFQLLSTTLPDTYPEVTTKDNAECSCVLDGMEFGVIWQEHYREVMFGGSRMVKLWADEQKRHIRPSLWVGSKSCLSPRIRKYGK